MIHFVGKGWGFEKWIVNNDKYCGKLLYFAQNRRCSLHYHKNKDETFYIQSGKIIVYWSDEEIELIEKRKERLEELKLVWHQYETYWGHGLHVSILTKGQSFHIPPGRVHMMVALEDTELFEFSTHHEDSDSYRIIKGD